MSPSRIDQVRRIAKLSRRRFWLCGDWIREQPLSVSDVTARRLTAVEALDLIGPVGLDEVNGQPSFNVKWRDRGWGPLTALRPGQRHEQPGRRGGSATRSEPGRGGPKRAIAATSADLY